MKRFIPILACLLLSMISHQVFAQKIPTKLAQNIDSSLYEHFKAKIPHHFCPCNNCEHWYNGKFKALKTGRQSRPVSENVMEERIAIWGVAGADQYSPFGSSKTTVQIYAEYIVIGGEYQLTMLKWKQSDCMKYQVLVEDRLSKKKELEEVEDEVTAWALESDVELDTPKELANPGPSKEDGGDEQEGEILEWALDATEGDFDEGAEWEIEIIDPNVLEREDEPVADVNEEEFIAESGPSTDELKKEQETAAPAQVMMDQEESMAEKTSSTSSDTLDLRLAKIAAPKKTSTEKSSEPDLAASKAAIKEGILAWSLEADEDTVEHEEKEADPMEDNDVELIEEKAISDSTSVKAESLMQVEIGIVQDATKPDDPQAMLVTIGIDNPTDVKYKDAVIKLDFLTKTETVLGTETHTIYEYFSPKEKTTFTLEVSFPKHAQTAQVEVQKLVEVPK